MMSLDWMFYTLGAVAVVFLVGMLFKYKKTIDMQLLDVFSKTMITTSRIERFCFFCTLLSTNK